MTNKQYVRGRAYEYKVKRKLEKEGWLVIRSAGSHSLFDLIAIKPRTIVPKTDFLPEVDDCYLTATHSEIKLIQCKVGDSQKEAIKTVEKTGIKEKYEGLYSVSVEVV